MAEWCDKCGVEILIYRLMSNHVHLIATPESEDCLRQAIYKLGGVVDHWLSVSD
jgi:putative transposase